MARARTALALALVAVALIARPAGAAVEITISLSPGEGIVGRPVEVLVRTYVPVGAGDLGLPRPSFSYPLPSGLWNVLYPIPDFAFDVEARSPTGETTRIELTRDSSDASLWRGTFTPATVGEWSVAVANFPTTEPTRFTVAAGETVPATALIGIAALLVGLAVGMIGSTILAPRLRKRR